MVVLTRRFYHKICMNPQYYGYDTMEFENITMARDFCYTTYRNSYSSMEVPSHMTNLPQNVQVIVYDSPMSHIECFLEIC